MTSLLDHIRLHQQATDATDAQILSLLCDFIRKMDSEDGPVGDYESAVIYFLQDNLARGPGDIPVPAWQLPMFSDEDREAIVSSMMDELADESLKDRAHDALEHLSLVETIGYVFPDNTEELVSMLQSIEKEDYVNGEFLRTHDEDYEYSALLDFAVRMGLLTKDEETVTDLGRQFIGEHS